MPYSDAVCLGFWVGTGSRDEPDSLAGTSHFLEHLLFKGTSTRTAREIAEQVDRVGGDMNAFTTKEYTAFYIRLLAEDIDLGLEILCDILTDPSFLQKEVDSERQVILEEVLMHMDEPSDLVVEYLFESLYPNHPLGREVLGTPEIISTIGVGEIRSFFQKHYLPKNIVFSAAGNISHDKISGYISDNFRYQATGERPNRRPPKDQVVSLKVTQRDTEQAQLAVGFKAVDRHSPYRYALSVVNQILGGGLSSRLFQKIREERGLAYSIGSERVSFADTGALMISVGTNPANACQVLDLVDGEIEEMARSAITEKEFESAKKHLAAETLLSIEDCGSRMSRIGASLLLHDDVITVEEVVSRINAVTMEDVRYIAAEVFNSNRSLSVVGPFSKEEWEGFYS